MSDATERLLQGLRQRGELPDLYAPIRELYQTNRRKLDALLLKKPLADSKMLAEVQYLQGQCEGNNQVLQRLDQLSQLTTTKQPSRRPDPA